MQKSLPLALDLGDILRDLHEVLLVDHQALDAGLAEAGGRPLDVLPKKSDFSKAFAFLELPDFSAELFELLEVFLLLVKVTRREVLQIGLQNPQR